MESEALRFTAVCWAVLSDFALLIVIDSVL